MLTCASLILHLVAQPHFSFPSSPISGEEIALRWIHFIAGIIWIGLLYFFNLVGAPTMKELEAATRLKVYPALMSRAMTWFRWSALVTVLVGLRYYTILLEADAQNAGHRGLLWTWLGEWFLVWLVAYAILYPLQMPSGGPFANAWIRAILIAIVTIVASWVILRLNASPYASNAHLCISVGGGIGLVMLMNVWGIVWRVQKRMIQWTRAADKERTPMPPEAARMMEWSQIASRAAFWLSFPMLFFMAAAEHYPFLSGISH